MQNFIETAKINTKKNLHILVAPLSSSHLDILLHLRDILLQGMGNQPKIKVKVLIPQTYDVQDKPNFGLDSLFEIKYYDGSGLKFNTMIIPDPGNAYNLTFSNAGLMDIRPSTYNERKLAMSLFDVLWNNNIKNKNDDLQQIQRDFINICAHEMRAPLHPIMLQADILLKKVQDPNQFQMIDSILSNANKLSHIIDDLLEMTRIESDLLRLDKEKFNLNDFIESLYLNFKQLIHNDLSRKNDLKIKYESDDSAFFIEADKDRLYQAFANVLNNSIKFTEKGQITVTVKNYHTNHVLISITDTGSGIEETILPKLFSKFQTTSTKGLGLGLYISKNIIESHGGKIWAENNMPSSSGSTFNIVLPTIVQTKTKEKPDLLIVDDDISFVSLLDSGLKQLGYNINSITKISKLKDDFIYGFYSMIIINPIMENDDLYNFIKKIKFKDKIKVCYLTKGKTNYEPFSGLYEMEKDEMYVNKTSKINIVIEKIDKFYKS